MRILPILLLIVVFSCQSGENATRNISPPNVILVMTDDQGIGDLSCHGNPWLKTPNIDAFYEEAVRMTDFHVSPLCTPTRSAIMTGRYPINNGAWATFKGRDAIAGDAPTMADLFRQNGYKTGIFGKWHLGDNYPVRPTDCGFDVAIHHLAGGVGELSDYWGNSYFDDVYYVNNEPKQFEGYCTDVWFEEAMKFIEENQERPFFAYIPTNAPHDPWIVDSSYAVPFRKLEGDKIANADFYGMLVNIDENFGKLNKFLNERGLAENTILIFMTDNGTSGGVSRDLKIGYNKGFYGRKGYKTEGGHRVPFFIRWPNGKIEGGKDINELTAHIDLIPTLAGLCDLPIPKEMKLDGMDFSPLLTNEKENLENRTVFIHHRQDWRPPFDLEETCLMNGKWRLINGKELFDIENDPLQENNLADSKPDVLKQFFEANEAFINKTKSNIEYDEFPVFVAGNDKQKELKLTIQHAIGEDRGIWKTAQVAAGMKNTNNTHSIEIERDGEYLISCRRWPKECPGPVLGVPPKTPKGDFKYEPIKAEKVRIQIANQMHEKNILLEDDAVEFKVNLEKGKTFLVTDFIEGKEKYGVYYTYVQYLGNTN